MFYRPVIMIMTTKLFILLFILAVTDCEVSKQQFIFDTVFSVETLCSRIIQKDVISGNCREQLLEACRNETVLLTMLDASSKFPYTGMMEGSRLDLGGFDQCININHAYDDGRILGKHCLGGFVLPDWKEPNNTEKLFKLSTCIPNQCTAEDYNRIFGNLLDFPDFPLFNDYQCTTNENAPFEKADIVTISIIIICVFLMITSTMYDVYLQKKQLKPWHPLSLAFSVLSHGRKLLQTSKGTREQIQVFHGIRVISMMWIIAGHGFASWNNYSVINAKDLDHFQYSMEITYVDTAHVAVDTFFYISGFLMSYLYLKSRSKPLMAQIKSVPFLYLHRYLRLTPAVLMLYLTFLYFLPHLGTGPLFHEGIKRIREPCEQNWWAFFLYIQNYHNNDNICLVHTWYLSADMQMFLVAPLVVIPLAIMLNKRMFKLSMIMMLVLNMLLIAIPMAIELSFTDYRNGAGSHSRLITYFVGIMMGAFMREKKDEAFLYDKFTKKIISLINLIIWIVVLVGMLIMLIYYENQNLYHGYESQTVYNYLMRPAWCCGLSWIVYSCYHGYGGFINWFLTRPIFQVGGKLSYCMYLLHGLVISHYVMSARTRMYFSHYVEFYLWCGYFILTTISSFFWTLAFESPMITIEKFIFGGLTSKEKSRDMKHEQNP